MVRAAGTRLGSDEVHPAALVMASAWVRIFRPHPFLRRLIACRPPLQGELDRPPDDALLNFLERVGEAAF